jgi:Fe-S cluster assembly protein SufD
MKGLLRDADPGSLLERTPEELQAHRRDALKALETVERYPHSRYLHYDELHHVSWKLEGTRKDPEEVTSRVPYPVHLGPSAEDETVIALVNGHLHPLHTPNMPFRLLTPEEALQRFPAFAERWMRQLSTYEDRFALTLRASWTRALIVHVPRNTRGGQLRLLRFVDEEGLLDPLYVHVLLEPGATLSMVEELYSTRLEDPTLIMTGVEAEVGDEAHLRYTQVQALAGNAYFAAYRLATTHRYANMAWLGAALGARKAYIRQQIRIEGEGSQNDASELFLLGDHQQIDMYAELDHAVGGAQGTLLSQAVLRDHARKVFTGMIRIRPGAQKSNAFQADHNLMLSPNAKSDSIPSLEIEADDVRATHAASMGRVDEEKLFYLQARGIPLHEARKLMVFGHFGPTLDRMDPATRERVLDLLESRWKELEQG